MVLSIRRYQSWLDIPTKSTWGECWWTARDICISNVLRFEEPLQTLADELAASMERQFFYGR